MIVQFNGATRTVTGSNHLLRTPSGLVALDCGMFQGSRYLEERNRREFRGDPAKLRCLILSHAHIDHAGMIPRTVADGFKGRIFATPATIDLCRIMLRDSAHIQEEDAKYCYKKWRQHGGPPPPQPLYTIKDAERAMLAFRPVPYDTPFEIDENLTLRFLDAGHILGAAIVELTVRDGTKEQVLVFSGDLGMPAQPILRDPTPVTRADFLLMETTYGFRLHEPMDQRYERFVTILNETIKRGGKVVIPAFAVGRTQTLLFDLNTAVARRDLPRVPVYVDSPLASSATEVFRAHRECFDEEADQLLSSGDDPFDFPGLHFTQTVDESKAINEQPGPAIILSASGMCNAGRIRHHLKHTLGDPKNTILFVGFQARGTLGRELVEGATTVRFFNRDFPVKAQIAKLSSYSAHADQRQLLDWFAHITPPPQLTMMVHGEEFASFHMAQLVEQEYNAWAYVPHMHEQINLDEPEHLKQLGREQQWDPEWDYE
jgi:metallo-beta-lactamase family protein